MSGPDAGTLQPLQAACVRYPASGMLRFASRSSPGVPVPEGAPAIIHTARLVLRRPTSADAPVVFARYASDPEVTRFLGWPRHTSVEDTRAFISFSDTEWERWPCGPYLICAADGLLLGGTGLTFETPWRAATGYVLARDAWGAGYATEALGTMLDLAPRLGLRRLHAWCHPTHAASRRVLEKSGFELEGVLRQYAPYPNLGPGPMDSCFYARVFSDALRAVSSG
jgi:RimJ/RimL family protein N-acetyltransferase